MLAMSDEEVADLLTATHALQALIAELRQGDTR
jgi:hypothetical protein